MNSPSHKWPLHHIKAGCESGLVLTVKTKPNTRPRPPQLVLDVAGLPVLVLAIAAVPEQGKANASVCALIAAALGIPKSSVSVLSGKTSPHKQILLRGDSLQMEEKCVAWFKSFAE
jgi:uncharacterized protein YggU (UPF0235/DUF167 family)